MKNGVPYTCSELSTAIERPGVSGTPWAPTASRFIGQPGDPEKHKRSVLASHFLCALRIGAHPLTDALQRHLLSRDDVALDENTADRNVWVSVMGIVGDAQHCSVFQTHTRRPLDLDQQGVRLILDPADLKMLAVEGAVEDLAAIVVGHEFAAGASAVTTAPC